MLRTHHCNELTHEQTGARATLAGWVDTIRDHGSVKFLDLRDHNGITQIVFHDDSMLEGIGRETVIAVTGVVCAREAENINPKLATGMIELHADSITVLGACRKGLPFEIRDSIATREEVRLKYRFLDLRNPVIHQNIVLRSKVINFLRKRMEELGFLEIQTPILTASSPEGARDYLVPSRKFKGRFYALPQAILLL